MIGVTYGNIKALKELKGILTHRVRQRVLKGINSPKVV